MGKCRLCGRTLQDNKKNYGSGCVLKCYSLLNMDYKKIKNKETTLNNRITKITGKFSLSNTAKVVLTDRYLTLNLLENVNIPYYNKYKRNIKKNINSIEKYSATQDAFIKLQEAFEIYKFYNKFLPVLKNKSKEIIFSEATQNIVWNALNFGLNRHYNKKEYLSGLTQQLQYVFWKGCTGILKVGGYDVSARFLNHAISEKPEDLYITDGVIIKNIKEDETFKNKIKELVKGESSNDINIKDSIVFNNGDLEASFHIMDLFINGKKINNSWRLHIKLKDTYDFTDLKELHEYIDSKISGFILSTANNAAMLSTSCNVINVYNVTIEFDYEVGD